MTRVMVCAAEEYDGVSRDCTDMPVPLADVAIASGSEPFIPEELRTDVIVPAGQRTYTEYMFTEDLYTLEWLEQAPQPEE
ncbi:hypothetical protein JQS43_21660 [Natronosporangium hydrolyticum]|uniref:Uncharacterized protein n=1 Tax=Natronosporangium hydrolyticum TaxID=2811111 RepID=A0A895YJ04_9ACTN|nr:hypothetical protein [Natronosporangium hydrolyticum]QSB14110.1 hypothetical protein JQS43_21660 [Natronosporangium hydrolyticum]